MTLRRLSTSISLAAVLAVGLAACEDGDGEDDRPRVRRSRGAAVGQLAKENVSKVAYPFDVAIGREPLEPGGWRTGQLDSSDPLLDDRTHYDIWLLAGEPGERIVITMESEEFDAFLVVAGPIDGEASILAEDDDGAGGTDARVELVVPESGRYAVIANTVFPSEVGRYRIRMESAETTVSRPTDRRTADDR